MLVEAREASGLTQADVAKRLGKPQSFVSKYERGERRLDLPELIELLEVLIVNPVDFITAYKNRIHLPLPGMSTFN